MILLSLQDIKDKTEKLALRIDAPADLLPTYGHSRDFGYPHIEVDSAGLMHYVVVERGQELERKTTSDLDQLLYWIFADVTFSMAGKFEVKNRIRDKDSRRMMFAKQEELLGILSNPWRQKEREEHQRILERHPFDDLAGLRAIYCGQLRQQGYTETEINKLAYDRYPQT